MPQEMNMGSFGAGANQQPYQTFDATGGQQQMGGVQQPNQQPGNFGNEHSNVPTFGNEGNENEDDSDLSEIFSAFADDEDDDEDGGSSQNQNQNQNQNQDQRNQQVQQLEQEIRQAISQMRIPDEALPQDLDVSDRSQLQQVLNRTVQAAVGQSLSVVFKPMQAAMREMMTQVDSMIQERVRNATEGLQERTVLEQVVPEVNDPKYSGMIRAMDETLKAKGRNAKERSKAIRKMLNQMGISGSSGNSGNQRSGGSTGPEGGTLRRGTAALDSFFGAFPSR